MGQNILIVNQDTQEFTSCAIKSVNKTTPGCSIFVFDNSVKMPFVNEFSNVKVLDNTKGQITEFKIKDSTGISYRHCLSVEMAFGLIDGGFLLLDSDVLVKKNLLELFDDSYICAGDCEYWPIDRCSKIRISPYCCYINTDMCKERGIHYFNENDMFGISNSKCDTGTYFYEQISELPIKQIRCSDYVEHFGGGSWDLKKRFRKGKEWLEKYSYLWDDAIPRT